MECDSVRRGDAPIANIISKRGVLQIFGVIFEEDEGVVGALSGDDRDAEAP